jgi:hypothetical protein
VSVACLIAPHAPPPIPLPQHAIPQPDSSVRNLPATQQEVRDREGRMDGLNWAEFQAIQQQARTLDGIMVQNRQGPVVKLPGRDDFPITAGVSDNFFDVLGVQAAMGRVFHAGSGADGPVVFTDRYWKTALLRQHLSESLLLAAAGTALGLLLADWLIDFAPALLYAGQRYSEYYIRLDARVFAFSAGAMLLVALVALAAATIPARRTAHADPIAALCME